MDMVQFRFVVITEFGFWFSFSLISPPFDAFAFWWGAAGLCYYDLVFLIHLYAQQIAIQFDPRQHLVS